MLYPELRGKDHKHMDTLDERIAKADGAFVQQPFRFYVSENSRARNSSFIGIMKLKKHQHYYNVDAFVCCIYPLEQRTI